jgi:hypothetical protein
MADGKTQNYNCIWGTSTTEHKRQDLLYCGTICSGADAEVQVKA